MKLWIIYNKYYENNATYSPQMMCESAKRYKIDYELYFAEYFSIRVYNGQEVLFYKNEKITYYPDVAFFRCYNFDLMEYLENKCVKLINSCFGMKIVRDKFATHKVVNKLKVRQPKVLKTNLGFDEIVSFLGVPFVMKDNVGSKGKNVYLVENEQQLEKIKNENIDIKFIYQEYIQESKGNDIRLYIVGNEVIGAVKRISKTDDFRANISLGGFSKNIIVPDYLKKQALSIAKTLELEICSVDYLITNNDYVFCEANGSAAFSAFINNGYKMQDLFMAYISNKYKNFQNCWAEVRRLEKLNKDFVFDNRNSKIVLSAPHNVSQYRDGVFKVKDLGSGELVLKLANENNYSYIIKTKNFGNETKNDDANFYEDCEFRKQLLTIVNKDNVLIDIHSIDKSRSEDICIGTNKGKNINNDFSIIENLKSIFESKGLIVNIDKIFLAKEQTISADINKKTNAKCIQIEIKSSLINPKDKNNKIELISGCLCEFFKTL